MNNVQINTPCGELIGLKDDDCLEFRGIEYAKSKRWEYPVQITSWQGEYDATYFKACSYQRRGFEEDSVCNAFYHKEFRKGLSFTYSEDCLFLNIWAPENAENCPVIVYIHGGSFTGGSANEGHISGKQFAKNGVIFISINYRLGPFGFCSHPNLRDKDGVCGNFGIYDQYTALKWIKDNIAAFGGNPHKITVLGQSAGAMSVDIHISSPLCKGWFSGAVMMSGPALQRGLAKPLMPEKTKPFWDEIIKNSGVNTIEELRQVDAKTLYYAWLDACKAHKAGSMLYTLPVCDGRIITRDSFNMNTIPDMPLILGMTITDMVPVALERLIKKFAKKTNTSKCYVYNFDRNLPGDDSGAWHSCDLLYAFSTLDFNWRPFEDIDYKISHQMSQMLCAFANTGNPNCDAVPEWNSGYKMPMHFCENTAAGPWKTGELFKNTFGNKGAEF